MVGQRKIDTWPVRRLAIAVSISTSFFLLRVHAGQPPKRVALVIGNAAYRVHRGTWVHARRDGAEGIEIAGGRPPDAERGQWHRFTVQNRGWQFTIHVDGRGLYKGSSPWHGGKVGLIAITTGATFDDVVVEPHP